MMKAVQHCQPSFPANALWPQTNLQPGIIHVSHSLIAGTTFKSASLIRSWTTGDTCIHFANKSPPPSFIWYLHSCTALWTLEENGSSSTSTLRPTDSTGESSLLSFFLSFFKCCSIPRLQSFVYSGVRKLLFVSRATEQAISMAQSEVRHRLVMLLESSTHFLPLDAASQRLISSFRTHFAFRVWQHVASIPHTRPAHVRHMNNDIINLTTVVERRFLQMHTWCSCTVWETMTNNGSGTSLSLLIQSHLLLTPPAVYRLCLKSAHSSQT